MIASIAPQPQLPAHHDWLAPSLPLTRAGVPKQRLSWEDKLRVLDPISPLATIEARLEEFLELFAYRKTKASITQVSGGPRAWKALRGRIYLDHVVRHLLGASVPSHLPQWVAARSFERSMHFVIDVDVDRPPAQRHFDDDYLDLPGPNENAGILQQPQQQHERRRPTPSFPERCQTVALAFSSLGINVRNPRHVYVQQTPRGGRHYYVFMNRAYWLDQYEQLLTSAGLQFAPGQFELYPSTTHPIRLPCGHLPGHPQRRDAWIQLVDDVRNGWIKRFSLEDLCNHQPKPRPTRPSSGQPTANQADLPRRTPPSSNPAPCRSRIARGAHNLAAPATPATGTTPRYLELIERGPQSIPEAEELMRLGILAFGTRVAVLKHLAAHLVWIKQLPPTEATEVLVCWAMNPRHQSQDIQHDLRAGTNAVAEDISHLCQWYHAQRSPPATIIAAKPLFAAAELVPLVQGLRTLPNDERLPQAHFYLSFLGFAKRHGRLASNAAGWEAAPAIRAVVRRWPGCHHMNYKRRFEQGNSVQLLTMTKEKRQAGNGKGRARTYLLAVPIVPQADWVLSYDDALKLLTAEAALDPPGDQAHTVAPIPNPIPSEEAVHANNRYSSGSRSSVDFSLVASTTLRASRARSCLASRSHECPEQPDAAPRIPGAFDGRLRAHRTASARPRRTTDFRQTLGVSYAGLANHVLKSRHPIPLAANPLRFVTAHLRRHSQPTFARIRWSLSGFNQCGPPSEHAVPPTLLFFSCPRLLFSFALCNELCELTMHFFGEDDH